MKKQKFTGKLSLNKETITRLNEAQQNQILGGSNIRCTGDLASCDPCKKTSSPPITCQVGPCGGGGGTGPIIIDDSCM